MITYFQNILALPDSCVDNSPMPKNFFEKKFKLTASETKMLKVAYLPERITWMASVKPLNSSIPIYQSSIEYYKEVQVFVIQILPEHYDSYAERIIQLVHKYIPYHSLVILHDQQRYQISCSTLKINQAAIDKRVLDQVYTSPICSLILRDNIQSKMEEQIRFGYLSHVNLQSMYLGYIEAIVKARANEVLGDEVAESNPEKLWTSIRKAKQDETQIKALKEKIRKAKTLQEKVELQMALSDLQKS